MIWETIGDTVTISRAALQQPLPILFSLDTHIALDAEILTEDLPFVVVVDLGDTAVKRIRSASRMQIAQTFFRGGLLTLHILN